MALYKNASIYFSRDGIYYTYKFVWVPCKVPKFQYAKHPFCVGRSVLKRKPFLKFLVGIYSRYNENFECGAVVFIDSYISFKYHGAKILVL